MVIFHDLPVRYVNVYQRVRFFEGFRLIMDIQEMPYRGFSDTHGDFEWLNMGNFDHDRSPFWRPGFDGIKPRLKRWSYGELMGLKPITYHILAILLLACYRL